MIWFSRHGSVQLKGRLDSSWFYDWVLQAQVCLPMQVDYLLYKTLKIWFIESIAYLGKKDNCSYISCIVAPFPSFTGFVTLRWQCARIWHSLQESRYPSMFPWQLSSCCRILSDTHRRLGTLLSGNHSWTVLLNWWEGDCTFLFTSAVRTAMQTCTLTPPWLMILSISNPLYSLS